MNTPPANRRVLVIDDMDSIQQDFRKILCPSAPSHALADAEAALFGAGASAAPGPDVFELDTASQGQAGLRCVIAALAAGTPYALAFVDMRMPPGWDGVETIEHLWRADPDLQVVICTAYSDHAWADVVDRLGRRDNLLLLKKPFDPAEVQQLACALTEKWNSTRQRRAELAQAEQLAVDLRAANLTLQHEVTQRRLTTEALNENQRQLATLLRNLPGMAYRCRNDGQWTMEYVSDGCRGLTGHECASLIGNRKLAFAELIHPDDAPAVWEGVQAALEKGQPFELEYRILNAHGFEVWVWERGRGVFDFAGNLLALEGFITDVTEHRRAKEALHAAHERLEQRVRQRTADLAAQTELLRTVLGHVPYGVFWKNRNYVFEGCNELFARDSAGCLPADIVGKTGAVLHRTDQEKEQFARWEKQVIEEGQTLLNLEACHEIEPGVQRWYLASLVPRRDTLDTVIGMVGLYVDITAHKQAEERLRTAFAAAEAASRAKSDFLANMSHEIRTPMSAILGYAELLAEDEAAPLAPDQRHEALTAICRNGAHLLAIINDILDLSKIESGKFTIENVATAPRRIVAEVVTLLHEQAAAKGLELKVHHDPAVPQRILCDPVRLRQILINLVGNAIKFTERGGVDVTVVAAGADPAGTPLLEFRVHDTGIGMSPEQRRNLFQAFTQADASMTRRFGGTGLGLHVSRRLAEMLGGTIVVESAPARGSIFTLAVAARPPTGATRPLHAGPADQPPSPPLQTAPGLDRALPLTGRRILLAEDGPDNQKLITFHLRRAGADVTVVENGRQAVEALTIDGSMTGLLRDPCRYDLVLMDMQMPQMDGYGAARLLRSIGFNKPIIALTAHAMTSDRKRCIASGCNDYATKPISRHELVAMIRAHLESAAGAHPATAT